MNALVDSVMFPLSNTQSDTTVVNRLEHYLFIPCTTSRRLILYSHGNATTLSLIKPMLEQLAAECSINVLAYEYPGYGTCTGIATAETVKVSCLKAYNAAIQTYEFFPQNIVLMGRSIGTGPTLWLRNHINAPIDALILISPFTCIGDLIRHYPVCGMQHFASYFYSESFNNIDYIETYRGRLLLIHGQEDETIPFDMSLELHERCGANAEDKVLCLISGGTHNQLVWDIKEIAIFLNK